VPAAAEYTAFTYGCHGNIATQPSRAPNAVQQRD